MTTMKPLLAVLTVLLVLVNAALLPAAITAAVYFTWALLLSTLTWRLLR